MNSFRAIGVLMLLPTSAAAAADNLISGWGGGSDSSTALAGSDTHGVASIPDFSGVWHRWFRPGLGPSASGPGPVTNRSLMDGVSNYYQLVGDHTNPILKPQAADVVKKHGKLSLSGVGYPTPSNQCWPSGVPYVFWNFGMQMLQQPDKITILYLHDHEVRRVRMNQAHPARVTPSWYGDSVGHYEGDTLVIDTVGIKIGPYAMVDMYGTPHSQALHVVERYRVVEYEAARDAIEREAKINARYPRGLNAIEFDANYRGKHLQLEITVEDGGVFTTPWTSVMTYGRPMGEWVEHVCAENTQEYYNDSNSAVPTAEKAEF
jgi:hypothetical protein